MAQITWKNAGFLCGRGAERIGTFATPLRDGWGLTTDPDSASGLIVTDASESLTFVEIGAPGAEWRETAAGARRRPEIRSPTSWRCAEVWGNVIETECIVRVDPKTGLVLGWIDLTGIKAEVDPAPGAGT